MVCLAVLLPLALLAQRPTLVVPVIHTSHIEHLSTSAAGQYLVSAGEDAAKIWETDSGKLIRSIVQPKGQGFAAAALSPDLLSLVTAGNSYIRDMEPTVAPTLLLWNPLTGERIRQLHAFPLGHHVLDVRYSAHQKYLMVTVLHRDWQPRTELFDPQTGERLHSWLGQGSFSLSGDQVLLRQADAVGWFDIPTGVLHTALGEPCLAVHAVQDTLHLFTNTGKLVRWAARTQQTVSTYATGLDSAYLAFMESYSGRGRAQFSDDGKRLMVAELDAPLAEEEDLLVFYFSVFNTSDGELACTVSAQTSMDGRWGIFTPDLRYHISAPIVSENADNRSLVEAYSTTTGAFGHTFGLPIFETTTMANRFTSDLAIDDYAGGNLIVVRGRSFGGAATVFDTRTGKSEQVEEEDLDAYLQAGGNTKDDRWQLVCQDYLSYQLIDNRTLDTVATLLIGEDGLGSSHTWAVTTPSGLFDASPDMMEELHYVSGLEIIELNQLKARFYEPGLLRKVLGLNPDPLRSTEGLMDVPLYPLMEAKVSKDGLRLHIRLTPRDGGIGPVSLSINGNEMQPTDLNPQRADSLTIDLTPYLGFCLPGGISSSSYEPNAASNTLALRAYNAAGWLKSAALKIPYTPPARARGGRTLQDNIPTVRLGGAQPSLYAVIVGTSDYAGEKLDLQFADRDASYFHQALRVVGEGLFGGRVFLELLHTDAADTARTRVATMANVQAAFAGLVGKVKAQDILLVYFSGHGVNHGVADNSQFYYLTKDIESEEKLTDPDIRNQYAISSDSLSAWIGRIYANKKVMVLDACNSGKVIEAFNPTSRDLSSAQIRAFDRMKDRTGMFIITGSAADKVSFEASRYGQGLLTYSLLEGMNGPGLLDPTPEGREVDVMKLFQHAADRVPVLARGIGGIQTPMLAFPSGGSSFGIGLLPAGVQLPLSQEKPVFIRNQFQDEDAFRDELALGEALGGHFRDLTTKGAQAELVFFDVIEFVDAYSIHGRYKQQGEVVTVDGRLFKGKTAIGQPFKVIGKKTDMPGLVDAIMNKVYDILEQ